MEFWNLVKSDLQNYYHVYSLHKLFNILLQNSATCLYPKAHYVQKLDSLIK